MRKTYTRILSLYLVFTIYLPTTFFGQVKNYSFTQSNTSYTAITGGYVLVPADDLTTADDELYQLVDIGFDFTFNGIVYNNFGISSNGFIWFGDGVPDALTFSPISEPSTNLNGTGNIGGIISPLANDLQKRTDSPFGELIVRTTGTAPARVCTIQFSNWSSVSGGLNTIYNFQVKLFESTNQIAFVYAGFITDVFVSGFEVGLRGFDNTDYKNITGTTTGWAGVAAGSSNAAGSVVSSTVLPSNGTTFLWTPGASSLPLSLIQFNAVRSGSFNKISWLTGNESGITAFVIERSSNGKIYHPIGKVTAANSTNGSNYSFEDHSPAPGINYYRIKLEETAGSIKLSPIKTVRNSGTTDAKLYPNPAGANLTLELTSSIADRACIVVTNIDGKLMYQKNNIAIIKGENKFTIATEDFGKGIYVIKVLLENDLIMQRFIRQ